MYIIEAIERLCIATRADGRSPRTVKSYREKLGHLAAFLGADRDVASITTQELRTFVAAQYDAGLSPFTVSTRAKAVKRLFNWLHAEGLLEANPAQRFATPTPKRHAPKGIAMEDIEALLATCNGDTVADRRDRAIMLFLLDSGCRAGGLVGLRIDDLNFDDGLALVTEKGDKQRYVMFVDATADALQAWLDVRPECRAPEVFVGLRGKGPLTPSGLWQLLKRRAGKAGVTAPVGPHDWRHTFARLYLLSGGDLGTLSQILGHSDVRTTVDYYALYTVGELRPKHRRHSPVAQMTGGGYNGNSQGT